MADQPLCLVSLLLTGVFQSTRFTVIHNVIVYDILSFLVKRSHQTLFRKTYQIKGFRSESKNPGQEWTSSFQKVRSSSVPTPDEMSVRIGT